MHNEESKTVESTPPVQITYDVEIRDAIETKQLPFVVGVLADLAFSSERYLPRFEDRRFITVDRDNFDAVMKAQAPRVMTEVEDKLIDDADRLKVELRFTCLADFEPENVARQVEPLCRLLDIRSRMAQLHRSVLTALDDGVLSRQLDAIRGTSRSMIESIEKLDRLVSSQLDEILHAPAFQKVEATWRGLHYLVFNTPATPAVKIRVLNVSKAGLLRDLQRAPEIGQSAIYKKVIEESYGVFGGEPYGVLIGDYEFGHSSEDIELLRGMSLIGSAAHLPFIAAASPAMFDLDSFTDFTGVRDLGMSFNTETYSLWHQLREQDDSRYIGLVLPRFLLRSLYGNGNELPGGAFDYKENVFYGTAHHNYLWGNSAYAFGVRLTASFARYGWFAAICGVEHGRLVENLPCQVFPTDKGDVAMKCPTEVPLTDQRESELVRLGFISLCHLKNTSIAAFLSVPSCHEPESHGEDRANRDATLAARLDYVLIVSRFAHYLKVIVRDRIGCFMSLAAWERDLNNWISRFVMPEDSDNPKYGARFPLREARIQLRKEDSVRNIVRYKAIAHLRPHFQLRERDVTMRVEIVLPPRL